MKTFVTLASAALLMMIAYACTESKGSNPAIPRTTEPIPVRVVRPEKTLHQHEIKTSGYLTTDDEAMLSFKVGGVVKEVYVREGQRIKKGQLLAALDLTEVNATVSQAQSAYEKAQRDLSRATNLYHDSVATLEQLQNAQTAHDVALAQLNTATFNKGFSMIKAQADGYVLNKYVNAGQLVKSGDPVVRTNDLTEGKWILKAGVSDKQWAVISIGDKVAVALDAFADVSFDGKVLRKAETSDPATGAFTIDIEVAQGKNRFASGMFGAANIVTNTKSVFWEVPYEAVLDANGNEGFVFVTNDNLKAIRQPVVIASFTGDAIRIESGLENSDALIVSGSAYLTDESPIVVVP